MANTAPLTSLANWYVGLVLFAGSLALGHSLYVLYAYPATYDWLILTGLTILSGSFTIKVPSIPASISVSEVFVLICVLLFGAAPATVTVAVEGLVISLWLLRGKREVYRGFFNMAAPAASMWIASHLSFELAGIAPLSEQPRQIPELLIPLALFTVLFFLLNSWLVAAAVGLERGGSIVQVWKANFLWLSVSYFGGASVAAVLLQYTREVNLTALGVIVPLLVVSYLTFKTSMGRIEDANQHLLHLNRLYISTIETLAMAIDAKDQVTHGHIRRVQLYAIGLARKVGVTDETQIKAIEAAALLHDMGKLAVPEHILNKPGKLTQREFERIKLHASVGAEILSSIDFPYPVVPIVRHHHEHWDGSGYPDGLRGTDIPLGARILSVVDCFDALTSDRPYRPMLPDSDAVQILKEHRGTVYDPVVVDAFLKVYREIALGEVQVAGRASAFAAITTSSQVEIQFHPMSGSLENTDLTSEEMLVLFDLAHALSGHVSLADAGDVIFRHLRRILPASLCLFYVYDRDTEELRVAHACGENTTLFNTVRIPLGQRLAGWVAANRQTILNSDPVLDLGDIVRSLGSKPCSCLSAPLVAEGTLVGVLSLYSPSRDGFTEDNRRVVDAITRQVAYTVRRALEFEILQTSSYRDALTGLPNTERLKQFFVLQSTAEKSIDAQFSLLLIHVEDLGSLNDQFGREAVNRVLLQVADRTRRALRGGDILFRYSDDEFIALLTHTDSGTSRVVAARVEDAVSGVPLSDSSSCAASIKVGISESTAEIDLDHLIEAARKSLGTHRPASSLALKASVINMLGGTHDAELGPQERRQGVLQRTGPAEGAESL